jgi:hypothetical protein
MSHERRGMRRLESPTSGPKPPAETLIGPFGFVLRGAVDATGLAQGAVSTFFVRRMHHQCLFLRTSTELANF